MDIAESWRDCFTRWPEDLPRRGVLVTTFDEQILFNGFMTSDSMLLIQREAPDTVGARQLLLPYANVAALKIVDVVKPKALEGLGLQGKLSQK